MPRRLEMIATIPRRHRDQSRDPSHDELETSRWSSLLLVEDAAALAELFADVLCARQGYDVQMCVAVEDVEEMLDLGPYDLAIVDLSFPQEQATGLDALVEIHAADPETKLAIMTRVTAGSVNLCVTHGTSCRSRRSSPRPRRSTTRSP